MQNDLSKQIASVRKYRGDHSLRMELPTGDFPDLAVDAEYIDDDPSAARTTAS